VQNCAVTTVAVCIATLHRPVGLRALLESLAVLQVPDDVDLGIVVVDNDSAASARDLVTGYRERVPGRLIYVVEDQPGIPFARNRAIAAAGIVDWYAFVDDDETVATDWLVELLRVARGYDADVVTGTVLPRFVQTPPAWVRDGGFFERPRFPTGTTISYARTSNALVAGHLLTSSERPFNEALARSGGSDTHFFQRVRLGKGKIVWADDAVVQESVPASRVRAQWLVKREYRRGNTLSLCLRDLEDSPRRRVKRVAAAGVHGVTGLAIVTSSVLRGRVVLLRGLQRIAFACGLITGLSGHVYEEYRVIHGT
jgi:glycosyltransferase involved in cell wall biosynthesis